MNLQEEAERAENEEVCQKQAFTRKVRTIVPHLDAQSFEPLLSLLPPVQPHFRFQDNFLVQPGGKGSTLKIHGDCLIPGPPAADT